MCSFSTQSLIFLLGAFFFRRILQIKNSLVDDSKLFCLYYSFLFVLISFLFTRKHMIHYSDWNIMVLAETSAESTFFDWWIICTEKLSTNQNARYIWWGNKVWAGKHLEHVTIFRLISDEFPGQYSNEYYLLKEHPNTILGIQTIDYLNEGLSTVFKQIE